MIQEGRVDERRRRRGREAKVQRRWREKGDGCRGMRPWSRYIHAPVSGLCARVFVYLCGTLENPVDERDGRPREEEEEEKEEVEEEEEEQEEAEDAREGPYLVKGKDEDGGKSQWPTKVCCPFVTRERVGR